MGERGDFVGRALWRHAGGEVAFLDPVGGGHELSHRAGDAIGEFQGGENGGGDDEDGAEEQRRVEAQLVDPAALDDVVIGGHHPVGADDAFLEILVEIAIDDEVAVLGFGQLGEDADAVQCFQRDGVALVGLRLGSEDLFAVDEAVVGIDRDERLDRIAVDRDERGLVERAQVDLLLDAHLEHLAVDREALQFVDEVGGHVGRFVGDVELLVLEG